jgi:hypothetical protein
VATYHAVAAIGQAILGLLEQARPTPEFDRSQFLMYQSANFQTPMEEGISLYLYRVAVSTARRNLPSKTLPDGRRKRPPLPLDLHYLLTPWAKTATKQHRLLGWAMRVMEDTPTFPASLLNHYGPEPDTFLPDETVDIVNEPISLQDIFNVWEIAKHNVQVSVAYVARVVPIDSLELETDGPPVQTRVFEMGKVPGR